MFFKPKVARQDYEAGMLPSTRRAVFFDVLSLHLRKLLLCGAVTLVFTLPFLVSALMGDVYEWNLYAQAMAGELSDEAASTYLNTYRNMSALWDVVFGLLLSVGLAGTARVVKLLAWEMPVSVGRDFLKGVRQNGKQFLLLGSLVGLVYFACRYTWPSNQILPIAAALLLGPVAAYLTVTISVYDMGLVQHFKYALLLCSKEPLKTLGAALASIAIFIPQFLPNFYCHLFGRLVTGPLIPVVMLAWFCFSFYALDRHINAKRYPELLGRGLLGCPDKDSDNSENILI